MDWPNETDTAVRLMIADMHGCAPGNRDTTTALQDDLQLYGDDIHDLVDELAKRFGVDISSYRWYHHTGPEGFNPLSVIFRPWWHDASRIPIRVTDLVRSAQNGAWDFDYPDEKIVPRAVVGNWILVGLLVAAVRSFS